MDNKQVIKDLVNSLGENKSEFINSVSYSIDNYISSQGIKKCLTVVERTPQGAVYLEWEPYEGVDYVKRLIAFCRGQRYSGRDLDSALTDPVVKIVTNEFEKFYTNDSNSELLSKALMEIIFKNEVLSGTLINSIINTASAKNISAVTRKKATSILIHQMQKLLDTNLGHSISTLAGKAVTTAISAPIAHSTAMLIMKFMALHLKVILAKVLSSAAIKTMIAVAIKKFVVAAILAVFVKIIAAKLGISAGAVIAFVLIPLILLYIAREAYTLPSTLGEKVSYKVSTELDSNFININENIMEQIFKEFISVDNILLISTYLSHEPEIQSGIDKIIASMET
ncbi:MAG TPA: hypothetical protein DIC60_05975 [Lachnospiraceae bacterium]|nr:hypothetical protein [Lachnospiraceae bacterium]